MQIDVSQGSISFEKDEKDTLNQISNVKIRQNIMLISMMCISGVDAILTFIQVLQLDIWALVELFVDLVQIIILYTIQFMTSNISKLEKDLFKNLNNIVVIYNIQIALFLLFSMMHDYHQYPILFPHPSTAQHELNQLMIQLSMLINYATYGLFLVAMIQISKEMNDLIEEHIYEKQGQL